jgi:formylglycine-generating enzyme required for sulfatase activity
MASEYLQDGDPFLEEMVFIPAGSFQMGDSFSEGYSDELPAHMVTLDAFYMGKYEVTNAEYCAYLNSAVGQGLITVTNGIVYGSENDQPYCFTSSAPNGNPYYGEYSHVDYSAGVFTVLTKDSRNMFDDPIVMVTWYGAAAYCNWRSQQEGKEQCYNLSTWACNFNNKGYRLPTEAEWEYGARGGLSGKRFPWGDTISHFQANYYSSSAYSYDISPTRLYHPIWYDGIIPNTSPVGFFDGSLRQKNDFNWHASQSSYQTTSGANGYGLYDMAGNVYEWCNDWYSSTYYSTTLYPHVNPTGPTSGTYRVLRGGGWYSFNAFRCRVAFRIFDTPSNGISPNGFRLSLNF